MQIFYTSLNQTTRQMIDTAVGGSLNAKTPEGFMELFKEMVMNNYQWYIYRAKINKTAHVYDVDIVTALAVQVENLNKKIDILMVTQ